MRQNWARLLLTAGVLSGTAYGTAEAGPPVLPDEICADCSEWVLGWINRSDGVLWARVTAVEPEVPFTSTVGDWASVALGLPDHGGGFVLSLEAPVHLKGVMPATFRLRYKASPVESLGQITDGSRGLVRVVEGHEYIFFLKREEATFAVWQLVDVTEEPAVLPEVLANCPRSRSGGPRRRTTRSSGRSARHAPCLRKARAARPAAERVR